MVCLFSNKRTRLTPSCTPTTLLWPHPADLPSTTSAGSSLSSQRCNTWTTATPSWIESQPLGLNRCNASRTLQHALFSIHPNSPLWPPYSVTSTGFQLQADSKRWYRPSMLSMELHPSTSKHWSDHTPRREHFISLHYINWPAGTGITESKQRSLSEVATLLCSGTSVVRPMSGQLTHFC